MTPQQQKALIDLMKKGVRQSLFPILHNEEICIRWELGADTHNQVMKFFSKVIAGTQNECETGLRIDPASLKPFYDELGNKEPDDRGKVVGDVWTLGAQLPMVATVLMGMYSGEVQWKKGDGQYVPVVPDRTELHELMDGFYSRIY